LTINASTSSDTTVTACNSYLWNGTTYTTSGIKTFVTTNAAGCDSTARLHLTINVSTSSDTTVTACNSYLWNGTTYTTSGIKTFVTTNAAGCDSTARLHLTINVSTSSDTTVTACNSYLWNGTTYTTSGIKTFVTTNAAGCDSTARLHLTINARPSAPSVTISEGLATFCAGGSVVLASDSANGNQWYRNGSLLNGATAATYSATTSGNYTATFTAQSGCESVQSNGIVVTVNPLPTLSGSLAETVTSGTVFNYTPASATAGTTFNWTRAAVAGISNLAASVSDNIGIINETLVDTIATSVNVTYAYSLVAPTGCSNTQHLTVTVNPSLGSRMITVITNPKPQESEKIRLDATAMPNPTTTWFNLQIKGGDGTPAIVTVTNVFGQAIENHQKITPGTVLRLGQSWVAGTYFVEVIQGDQRKVIKIIKAK
jgi:hypothetical protein